MIKMMIPILLFPPIMDYTALNVAPLYLKEIIFVKTVVIKFKVKKAMKNLIFALNAVQK